MYLFGVVWLIEYVFVTKNSNYFLLLFILRFEFIFLFQIYFILTIYFI